MSTVKRKTKSPPVSAFWKRTWKPFCLVFAILAGSSAAFSYEPFELNDVPLRPYESRRPDYLDDYRLEPVPLRPRQRPTNREPLEDRWNRELLENDWDREPPRRWDGLDGVDEPWNDPLDDLFDNLRWPDRPAVPPWTPAPVRPEPENDQPPVLSESEQIHQRITRRYQNPQVLRFLSTLSTAQGLALYSETADLIDNRHLTPTTYQERTAQAIRNLELAVENETFRQANRIAPNAAAVENFRRTLSQLQAGRAVRTRNDAVNALRWAIDVARVQVGLGPGPVVAEFVYGAIESLDVYSAFIPPTNDNGPRAALEDHVVGIGVSIESHEQGAVIVKVLPGGPAEAAGLRKGDYIVGVNGRSAAGRSLDELVDQIVGQEGTPLQVDVRSPDGRSRRITLVRRYVPISSVTEVQMVDRTAAVGYMKLEQFTASSSDEMEKALWELHRQGMQSLILDLRGNPGGLLTSAIEISDKFLPQGSIVSTRGRTDADNTHEVATYSQTWKVPLVVLIDGNSASASEIFAAAIQENGRGLIVGQKSYGKGTVQTQFPLQTVPAGLRLTTARFYSPNGRAMADVGVTPDVVVDSRTNYGSPDTSDQDLAAAIDAAKNPLLKDLADTHSRYRDPRQNPHLIPS